MPDQPSLVNDHQQRVMRVFISSTFRDMQMEREELVKRVFPQLRKLCEQRGVTWGEVDLRWGISDEQKAEGKVLPICLAEIDNSRPYFIGLLGERYGWVPEEIPPDLIEREPWLAEHRQRSVTELEVLHGVLRNPRMTDHAFFYFRSPSFIDSLPPEEQAFFKELPTVEELEHLELDEAVRRAEDRRRRLHSLKQEIRQSDHPLYENYLTAQELCARVLQDFTALIDRLFPEGSEPDVLEREASDHLTFAESRARVYIGGEQYFRSLDAHIESDDAPLVVLGPSGSGKSALLANWALNYRRRHPDDFLFVHFIGATAGSTDWAAMLRRLMGEFKRQLGLEREIPDHDDALRAEFASWLEMISLSGRVVLILDALNQLEDREAAPDLIWLPPLLPANIRLVVSTLAGRSLAESERRSWPTLSVEPLTLEEREQLITQYLKQYIKALSQERIREIAGERQTSNPLYLRALLEELRIHGDHFTLDEKIKHYLQAETVDDLYELILERCEADYERERPGLVRDAMSLIWAARRGLSETELLELLGTGGQPLPRAHWSPFYLALEQSFISRSGLMGFSHDYFRQAVRDRYLKTEQEQDRAHLWLAEYFEPRPLNKRKLDELPWQLAQAKGWHTLAALLADESFLTEAWESHEYEVRTYWAQVEEYSPLRKIDAYQKVLRDETVHNIEYSWVVAHLLRQSDCEKEALPLYDRIVEHYRALGDRAKTARPLMCQGICWSGVDDEKAMQLYAEAEQVCREFDNKERLQAVFANQATIFERRGEIDKAIALYTEQERICREIGAQGKAKFGLVFSLCHHAEILENRGETGQALIMLKEAERIARENNDLNALHISLSRQANIFVRQGDLKQARRCNDEAANIDRDLGRKSNVAFRLGTSALIQYKQKDYAGARATYEEEEYLCLKSGDKQSLRDAYHFRAIFEKLQGNWHEALDFYKKEELLCLELGLQEELQRALSAQASLQARVLEQEGDWPGALTLYRKHEQFCRELDDKDALQTCLGRQALGLRDQKQFVESIPLLNEKAEICRELEDHEELGSALLLLGFSYSSLNELDNAIRYLREAEEIFRESNDRRFLRHTLVKLASVLTLRGEHDAAMRCSKESEQLCRQSGDTEELISCLDALGLMLIEHGELDEALEKYVEEESLGRETGNKVALWRGLYNQAYILFDLRRDAHAALPKCLEAVEVLSETGLSESFLNDARNMLKDIRAEV